MEFTHQLFQICKEHLGQSLEVSETRTALRSDYFRFHNSIWCRTKKEKSISAIKPTLSSRITGIVLLFKIIMNMTSYLTCDTIQLILKWFQNF